MSVYCKECNEECEWVIDNRWQCTCCGEEVFVGPKPPLTKREVLGQPPVKGLTINVSPKTPPFAKNFVESIRTMQHAVHENAKAHGWWDEPREDGTVMMLIVSELSELLEELRVGGRESAKIDGFTSEEEELADAVIRILDFAGRKGYRLGSAILAKHAYNLTRPHKHGGKLF